MSHQTSLVSIPDLKMIQGLRDFFATWISDEKPDRFESVGIFQYHGFDPKIVYNHILMTAKKAGWSQEKVLDDVFKIVAIAVIKGNATERNIKGLQKEGQDEVLRIISDWKIEKKIPTNPEEKKNAITFSRFSLALPVISVVIARQYGRSTMGPFGSRDLPSYMTTPAFNSCIPTGMNITQFLVVAANSFGSDLTFAISGGNAFKVDEKQKEFTWTSQLVFTMAGLQSPVMSQEQRCAIMVLLNVESDYEAIKKIVEHNSKEALVSLQDWTQDFSTIKAIASGVESAQNLLPSLKQWVIERGRGLAGKDKNRFPVLMSSVPRSSLSRNDVMVADFKKLYSSGMPTTRDGVPFETADPNDDCSDLQDYDEFLRRTEDFDAGTPLLTQVELRNMMTKDVSVLKDAIEEAVDQKLFNNKDKCHVDGQELTIKDWRREIEDKKRYVACLFNGQDMLEYLATSLVPEFQAKYRERQVELNRLILWNSSKQRREKIYSMYKL